MALRRVDWPGNSESLFPGGDPGGCARVVPGAGPGWECGEEGDEGNSAVGSRTVQGASPWAAPLPGAHDPGWGGRTWGRSICSCMGGTHTVTVGPPRPVAPADGRPERAPSAFRKGEKGVPPKSLPGRGRARYLLRTPTPPWFSHVTAPVNQIGAAAGGATHPVTGKPSAWPSNAQ